MIHRAMTSSLTTSPQCMWYCTAVSTIF